MSAYDALLGQLHQDGVRKEIGAGLNFVSPLTLTLDPATRTYNITGAGDGSGDLVFGADLTDADQTLTVADGANRRQPLAPAMTDDRVKTWTPGPDDDGKSITLHNYDTSGFTLTFTNGGYAGGDTVIEPGTKVTLTAGGGEAYVSNVEAL